MYPTESVPYETGDEKKEEEYTAFSQAQADIAVEEEIQGVSTSNKSNSNPNKSIIKSKKFGGDGGEPFNHGNHASIAKISVRHDGHAIHQISAIYAGANKLSSGSDNGDEVSLNFRQGEYIDKITIRHNKLVQCLTFTTNNGKKLGPVGGKGWKLLPRKDREGTEEVITAPSGYKLYGFSGSAGNYVDSIKFHWGPIN